jgi:MFS family permease
MSPKISLTEIEKRTYLTYHRDGLADIFLGACLLSWGLIARTPGISGLSAIAPLIFFFLWKPIRNWVIVPRLGLVLPSEKEIKRDMSRTRTMIYVFTATAILAIITFLAFTGDQTWWKDLLKKSSLLLFGIAISAVVATVAYLWSIKRLYAYAVFILASFGINYPMGDIPFIEFIISGSVILVIGIVLLITFLNKYKRPVIE